MGNYLKSAAAILRSLLRPSDGVVKIAKITPLPKIQVLAIFMCQFNEGLQMNFLFPFLVFMIESFGFTGTALGAHAGILASSFCAAQFLSSMVWGRLADRLGIKPCIIAGTLGSAVAFFCFGLATTYWQAVLARGCAGLLNGNVGLLKSYIGKLTDNTNRSAGFSF
jgi:MFS family permease